jgi:hypothetical protein
MQAILATLTGALLGLAWLLATHQPSAPVLVAPSVPVAAPVQAYAPQSPREQWALDLLARLGNTQPSGELLAMVVEWTLAEDGSDGALARNNALNTTLCLDGAMTGAINGDGACGVQGYATWADGIEATARTLEQSNFADVRGALLTNDAEAARVALWASPWAASHYGYGAAWPRVQSSAAQASAFLPIGADDCGYNATVALQANGGALMDVTIPPGASWSFNAAMGDPARIDYRNCAGVLGGYWCDTAARYLQVARGLGLTPEYEHHGLQLAGVAWEDSIAIWNVGGQFGGAGEAQDLVLTNTTPYTVRIQARPADGGAIIVGWVE